ncbi:hypothetical protein DRO56_04940 [Candidatus Bathyarchaeota archaeon]|nr:MAG: hypothetical protein CW700_06225 [Candidatus Bathyarchaeota archaeon]RLI31629.1 MAG: hypothetical protein DRO56_04940 [Candidatus Bathyarchaeota archaeon]
MEGNFNKKLSELGVLIEEQLQAFKDFNKHLKRAKKVKPRSIIDDLTNSFYGLIVEPSEDVRKMIEQIKEELYEDCKEF